MPGNRLEAVIFDIGGVLAFDVWEHLLLDDDNGIASQLALPRDSVREVGKKLWSIFAYNRQMHSNPKTDEVAYWEQFRIALNLKTEINFFLGETDKYIKPVINMQVVLGMLINNNRIKMGICSNNTSFWYARQRDKLRLDRFFKEEYSILSFGVGETKSSPNKRMFYEVVNKLKVDPEKCLFVDDRQENIDQAASIGMNGILFPRESAWGADHLIARFKDCCLI